MKQSSNLTIMWGEINPEILHLDRNNSIFHQKNTVLYSFCHVTNGIICCFIRHFIEQLVMEHWMKKNAAQHVAIEQTKSFTSNAFLSSMTFCSLKYSLWLVENSEHVDWHVDMYTIKGIKFQKVQHRKKTVANHRIKFDSMLYFFIRFASLVFWLQCAVVLFNMGEITKKKYCCFRCR